MVRQICDSLRAEPALTLIAACWNNRAEVVKLLLQHGAKVDIYNKYDYYCMKYYASSLIMGRHGELPAHNCRDDAIRDLLAEHTPLRP